VGESAYGDVPTLWPAAPNNLTFSRPSSTGTLKGTHMVNMRVKLNTFFSAPASTHFNYTPVPLGIVVAPAGTRFISETRVLRARLPAQLGATILAPYDVPRYSRRMAQGM
jgi:hypothetical protein